MIGSYSKDRKGDTMASTAPASTQRCVETCRIQRAELRDIVNRFPGVLVNNKVCFDVNAKVHALLCTCFCIPLVIQSWQGG